MTVKMATRQAYGEVLVELGHEMENLVVMDADLSKSTMTAELLCRLIPSSTPVSSQSS